MSLIFNQSKKRPTTYHAIKVYNSTPSDFRARDVTCRRLLCDDTGETNPLSLSTLNVVGSVDIDGTLTATDSISCTTLSCTTPTFGGHINLGSLTTLPSGSQLGTVQHILPSSTVSVTQGSTVYNLLSTSCVKGTYIVHARLRLSTTSAYNKFDVSEVRLVIAESSSVATESTQCPWRKAVTVPVANAVTYGDSTTDVYVQATTFASFTSNTTVYLNVYCTLKTSGGGAVIDTTSGTSLETIRIA